MLRWHTDLCVRSPAVWWLFIMCSVLATSVYGGPDGCPLDSCKVFHTNLNTQARHTLRDLIQGLQAIESHLSSLRLGRPSSPPTAAAPNETALQTSKASKSKQMRSLLWNARIAEQAGLSGAGANAAAAALAAACTSSHLRPDLYGGRPLVSILLNYFKRPQVVKRIAEKLQASCAAAAVPCELVVNVDNPHEAGSWSDQVANSSGFVVPVFSANLHEARGYNRAARAARGRYLVVWQDDQIPPTNGTWLRRMISLFETYPRLGVLGMNTYRMCRQKEGGNRWGPAGWEPDPRVGGIAWSYVHFTDFAPLALPAAVFWELGGLEEGFSRPGDCGISGDWELCARAWVAGWQVGYMQVEGREGDGEGSTHKPESVELCWGRQAEVGGRTFTKRYIHPLFVQEMCERVWALNMLTFKLPSPELCPYGDQTRGWANCTAPSTPQQRAALAEAIQLPPEAVPLPLPR